MTSVRSLLLMCFQPFLRVGHRISVEEVKGLQRDVRLVDELYPGAHDETNSLSRAQKNTV